MRDIYAEELRKLKIEADPETGRIFVDGIEAQPTILRTRRGYTYPRIVVYDPSWWRSKKYGNRPFLANRIIWAFAYGVCRGASIIKAKNGDIFDLRISNLIELPRRGTRQ